MLRIRFHGRGGQGMKTASRIVGTAAFSEGHHAQDAPVYGAERRGAPMAAFTRIDDTAILERGAIASPDIVVVADETLLDGPQGGALCGLTPEGIVLVNSRRSSEELRQRYAPAGWCVVLDATGLALSHVGSVAGLSVALGAATCQLAGLRTQSVEQAVRAELHALGVDPGRIEKNVALAETCFRQAGALSRVTPRPSRSPAAASPQARMITPAYQGGLRGTPSVMAPANTPLRKTGDWRVWRPVIDLTRCTQCWLCFVSCPDGAIVLDTAENPHIDYDVCKGCLICVEECPTHTIHTLREAEA